MSPTRSIAAVTVLILALGACDGDDPQVTADPPNETNIPTAATPTPEPSELPPITVDEPLPGDTVLSPVRISGTANVFEATVSIRIVTEDGTELTSTFTTATCGTGCRGNYVANVRFDVPEVENAFIEVYEESAENGEPLHLVSIPVVLSP